MTAAAMRWVLRPLTREPFLFLFLAFLFALPHIFALVTSVAHGLDLSAWRAAKSFSVSLLVCYLLTWLGCSSRYVKWGVYALALVLRFVSLFMRYHFMTGFTPMMFQAMFETNSSETREFLQLYATSAGTLKAIAYIAVCLIVIIAGERFFKLWFRRFNANWLRVVVSVSLFVTLSYGMLKTALLVKMFTPANTVENMYLWERFGSYDLFSSIAYSSASVLMVSREANQEIEVLENALKTVVRETPETPLHLVVIIGESYIKSHAHCYGYPLPTTPCLDKELESGNLILFDDIIASYNTTSESLKNVFSTNNSSCRERWCDFPLFPALFKQAGYFVTYWDNQWDPNKADIFEFSLGGIMHSKYVSDCSFNMVNTSRYEYDHQLVDAFESSALDSVHAKPRTLSMFHLMGQHMDALKRYPNQAEYRIFDTADIHRQEPWLTGEKKQAITNYDNATHYNDFVVGRLLDMMRDSQSVVIYFSDHGEEVYDIRDFKGREEGANPTQQVKRWQYGVPMMVWFSDGYMATHPDVVERIRGAAGRPGMLDDVAHLLLGLAHIDTPSYRPQRDIAADSYIPIKRLIKASVPY